MKFDIYGRFVLEIVRVDGRWEVFRAGDGVRRPEADLAIPQALPADRLVAYLEDVYHELARPERVVRRL
ncbi:MAG: hypothetical protein JJU06_01650 [Ectothiorhodospiraceae bacterium]|nr:hypothetical protein [Ectothiorhodospiraceae bacterium]MCH8502823.1 hypothetical protein [Ectothiorhodospiraceae bacterium]